MKVTIENYHQLPIPLKEKRLLVSLLDDLKEINENSFKPEIYIDWIDEHTKYSPERVDPCPDYYGMYTLRCEEVPKEIIGIEMNISELDICICCLNNYIMYL